MFPAGEHVGREAEARTAQLLTFRGCLEVPCGTVGEGPGIVTAVVRVAAVVRGGSSVWELLPAVAWPKECGWKRFQAKKRRCLCFCSHIGPRGCIFLRGWDVRSQACPVGPSEKQACTSFPHLFCPYPNSSAGTPLPESGS